MSIALGAYSFPALLHGAILDPPYGQQVIPQRFFGIAGAYVIVDELHDRVLVLEVTFRNYTTEALLRAAVVGVMAHQGDAGTLTVDGIAWPNSTFLGFEPSEAPWRDGSGVWGWIQRGRLRFLQTKGT